MTDYTMYKLACPKCGGTELFVRPEDVDIDDTFVGDPEVGCLGCGAILRTSELAQVETSDGQVVHLIAKTGGDA